MSMLITGSEGYVCAHMQLDPDSQVTGLDLLANSKSTLKSCISQVDWGQLKSPVTEIVHMADLRLQNYNAENLKEEQRRQRQFIDQLKSQSQLNSIVFASSCSVYGAQEGKISEDSAVQPTSFYAEAKLGTEEMIVQSGIPYTILRFGTAYGGEKKVREDLLVNMLVKFLSQGEPIDLFAVHHWRPYIHVHDFARALLYFSGRPQNQVLNVVECNKRKTDIVEDLKAFGFDLSPLRFNHDQEDIRNYFVEAARVFESGFALEVDFKTGLRQLVDHYAQ